MSVTTSGQPARPRRRNSAEQLLDAACKILTERNSTDLSLSDVAVASNLNSALVKYHFRNKEGLLLALVRRDAQLAMGQVEHLVSMTIPIEQKIRLHVHGAINTYAKYPYLNRLIHDLLDSKDENVVKDLNDFFVIPLVEAEAKLIQEGVDAGIFRKVEPMFFYYAVLGACDHLFYGRRIMKYAFNVDTISPELREQYADFVTAMAIRALRKGAE
jgi:TetR/AcrR family transcriptional regulator